ncbi:MAG: cytochrome c [Deltaproteobacteria bacterium]|nr:cytochrome c [Deltaproteobacteria bacterium]
MRALVALVLLSACASCAERPRYGASMAQVGHYFELTGRALQGGRLELARWTVHELSETFDDDVAHARPPGRADTAELNKQDAAFRAGALNALVAASTRNDPAALTAAFAAAATSCNACHAAVGFSFLEVSGRPGDAVPTTLPP